MFERDYIMKMVQQFFEMLNKITHGTKEEAAQEQLDAMYTTFFKKEKEFFVEADAGEVIDFLEKFPSQEFIHRVEMLAELAFRDALMQKDKDQKILFLQRAYHLFLYLDRNSKTYSFERNEKIITLEELLESGNK